MNIGFQPIREIRLQFFSLIVGCFIGIVSVTMMPQKEKPPEKKPDCSIPIKILKWNGAIVSSIEVLKKLPEGVKAINELDIEVRNLLSEPIENITDNKLEELNRNISEYYELENTSQSSELINSKLLEITYNACSNLKRFNTFYYQIPEENKLDILFCQRAPNFSFTDKP
jgi:hypothetical protein